MLNSHITKPFISGKSLRNAQVRDRLNSAIVPIVLILISLIIIPTAGADTSIRGAYAFTGFAAGAGARAMGMNGAYSAISDDSYSAYWNPAGLTSSWYKELSFTRVDLYDLDLITNNTLNISAPETPGGAMSFSWNRLSYEFESWKEEVYLVSYAKTLIGQGRKTGKSSRSSLSLSCGATFKYLRQTSDLDITPVTEEQSQGLEPVYCESKGYGLDLGVLARIRAKDGRNRFSIGLSLQDMPTQIKWNSDEQETKEYLPYRYLLGCSAEPLPRLTVALDLVGEQDARMKELHFGIEHWILPVKYSLPITEKNLALRGGIAKQLTASERMTFSGGLSVRWGAWQLDYAYLMDDKGLGDTRSRFSVSVRF